MALVCSELRPEHIQIEELKDIPIKVSDSDETKVDLDVVIREAQTKVREKLPEAQYRTMAFSGSCQELPRLDNGRVSLDFIQVERPLFPQTVVIAETIIYLDQGKMDLDIWSDPGPSTETDPQITDQKFREIVAIAHQHIASANISDCNIRISQFRDVWKVSCYNPISETRLCKFGIEAETGKITDVPLCDSCTPFP